MKYIGFPRPSYPLAARLEPVILGSSVYSSKKELQVSRENICDKEHDCSTFNTNSKSSIMTEAKQFNFPDGTEILFNKSNPNYKFNAFIKTGVDKFFLFSDSYKIGAQKLFEYLDGNYVYNNTLVYPIVFLCRHFIELRLKELISGINYTYSEEYSFPNGHSLAKLWNEYKTVLTLVEESAMPDLQVLKNVERLIVEFDTMDPTSMCFRYPVDKSSSPSLQIESIDLASFKQSMERIFDFLDSQSEVVFYLIDMAEEYFTGLRRSYYDELMSGYYN